MPYTSPQKKNTNGLIRKWAKKLQAIKYLGGKCQLCGIDNFKVLSFHHLDPSKKDFELSSNLTLSFENLKTELDKCQLLCNNCHTLQHMNNSFIDENLQDIIKLSETKIEINIKVTDEELITAINNGITSQRQLCDTFKMSKTTIQYRLRNLIKNKLIDNTLIKTKIKEHLNSNHQNLKKIDDNKLIELVKEHKYTSRTIAKYFKNKILD